MRRNSHLRFLVPLLLVVASGAAGIYAMPRFMTVASTHRPEDYAATQDIASAVAAGIDRGSLDGLPAELECLMARYPSVRAVEVSPDSGTGGVSIGSVADLRASATGPEVQRVTLVTAGRPWGTVRVLFARAPMPLFATGTTAFWLIVALAVLVLPVLAAGAQAVRRRLDRSPSGPIAAAAERAQHTLDTLAEGVLLLDADGRIAFANRTFCERIGSRGSSPVGQQVGDLPWTGPSGEAAPGALPWDEAVRSGEPVRGVRLGLRCRDVPVVAIVNCTPLFRKRKALHGVLVTLDDVTELERGRAALQEARDAAQHANEAKSRFLAVMSHEIRTPLNGVCGSLQLLNQTPLQDRQPTYVEAARFSASTLLHLINDILDFSKIEAGQLELSAVEFDLERSIDDTMLMMAANARIKGLDLAYHIDPHVAPRFCADPDRIRQIIINLVNNAIKFTARGSVTLSIGVDQETPGRQTLRCDVRDTGIGIPEEKRDRLFKAFSQVDSSTSRRYGGTGLGLVISKQLCELMGGRIEVASVIGQGTTFTFYLDLQQGTAPAAPAEQRALVTGAIVIGLHELEARTVRDALALQDERLIVASTIEDLRHRMGRPVATLPSGLQVVVIASEMASQARELLPDARIVVAGYQRDASEAANPGEPWMNRPLGARRLLEAMAPPSGAKSDGRRDAPEAGGTVDLTGLRVLLAEDNQVGQMVVSDMLRNAGAQCDAVGTGNEVLAALARQPYDAVLMDCFMPEMDGFEATRAVRALQAEGKLSKTLPIIALTAKAMRGDREACLEAGMDGYVSKPVDQAELLGAIAEHLPQVDRKSMRPLAPENPKASNTQELVRRFGHKPALLAKLAETFRATAAEDLARIQTAVARRDGKELEQAAHRLAGGAGFVSADEVRRLAADLERRAADHQLDGLADIAAQLRTEVAESVRELDDLVKSIPKTQTPVPANGKEP